MKEDKYSGELKSETFSGNADVVIPVKNNKTVKITFKENRKFELYIGLDTFVFMGHETKEIPEAYLLHPDFLQQEKFFAIGE